jgi:ankyrin repeat protein
MSKLCAQQRQADLMKLLSSGADPNVVVDVEWRDFATSPLIEAAIAGHVRIARMLLKAGAIPDAEAGPRGATSLYHAALNGHHACVQLLLEHGAQVNTSAFGAFSPLYRACQEGRAECVRLLLDADADADSDGAGATPLYVASQNGHAGAVEVLLSHRAAVDLDRPTADGSTALMVACDRQRARVVELLLGGRASLDATDRRGRSALDFATNRGDSLVVALLHEERAARLSGRVGGGGLHQGLIGCLTSATRACLDPRTGQRMGGGGPAPSATETTMTVHGTTRGGAARTRGGARADLGTSTLGPAGPPGSGQHWKGQLLAGKI